MEDTAVSLKCFDIGSKRVARDKYVNAIAQRREKSWGEEDFR